MTITSTERHLMTLFISLRALKPIAILDNSLALGHGRFEHKEMLCWSVIKESHSVFYVRTLWCPENVTSILITFTFRNNFYFAK